jgi:hypothetical protein
MNSLIKIARSAVSKNCAKCDFFLRRQPRMFENMTLVARRRKHIRGFWAIFWVAQLPPKEVFYYTRIQWLLVNSVVISSSHALWRVISSKLTWMLGHYLVDNPNMNIFEGDSVLSKFVVCSTPSRSRRPRLRLCQRKRFSQKRFRLKSTPKCTCTILHSVECMRTRQSQYETDGDGSDEGDSSHWIVLFCDSYWLSGDGGRGSRRRALSGQDSPNIFFWNWNGVVRFESQEVLGEKKFVIWHFRNYCLVQIVSLWSLL